MFHFPIDHAIDHAQLVARLERTGFFAQLLKKLNITLQAFLENTLDTHFETTQSNYTRLIYADRIDQTPRFFRKLKEPKHLAEETVQLILLGLLAHDRRFHPTVLNNFKKRYEKAIERYFVAEHYFIRIDLLDFFLGQLVSANPSLGLPGCMEAIDQSLYQVFYEPLIRRRLLYSRLLNSTALSIPEGKLPADFHVSDKLKIAVTELMSMVTKTFEVEQAKTKLITDVTSQDNIYKVNCSYQGECAIELSLCYRVNEGVGEIISLTLTPDFEGYNRLQELQTLSENNLGMIGFTGHPSCLLHYTPEKAFLQKFETVLKQCETEAADIRYDEKIQAWLSQGFSFFDGYLSSVLGEESKKLQELQRHGHYHHAIEILFNQLRAQLDAGELSWLLGHGKIAKDQEEGQEDSFFGSFQQPIFSDLFRYFAIMISLMLSESPWKEVFFHSLFDMLKYNPHLGFGEEPEKSVLECPEVYNPQNVQLKERIPFQAKNKEEAGREIQEAILRNYMPYLVVERWQTVLKSTLSLLVDDYPRYPLRRLSRISRSLQFLVALGGDVSENKRVRLEIEDLRKHAVAHENTQNDPTLVGPKFPIEPECVLRSRLSQPVCRSLRRNFFFGHKLFQQYEQGKSHKENLQKIIAHLGANDIYFRAIQLVLEARLNGVNHFNAVFKEYYKNMAESQQEFILLDTLDLVLSWFRTVIRKPSQLTPLHDKLLLYKYAYCPLADLKNLSKDPINWLGWKDITIDKISEREQQEIIKAFTRNFNRFRFIEALLPALLKFVELPQLDPKQPIAYRKLLFFSVINMLDHASDVGAHIFQRITRRFVGQDLPQLFPNSASPSSFNQMANIVRIDENELLLIFSGEYGKRGEKAYGKSSTVFHVKISEGAVQFRLLDFYVTLSEEFKQLLNHVMPDGVKARESALLSLGLLNRQTPFNEKLIASRKVIDKLPPEEAKRLLQKGALYHLFPTCFCGIWRHGFLPRNPKAAEIHQLTGFVFLQEATLEDKKNIGEILGINIHRCLVRNLRLLMPEIINRTYKILMRLEQARIDDLRTGNYDESKRLAIHDKILLLVKLFEDPLLIRLVQFILNKEDSAKTLFEAILPRPIFVETPQAIFHSQEPMSEELFKALLLKARRKDLAKDMERLVRYCQEENPEKKCKLKKQIIDKMTTSYYWRAKLYLHHDGTYFYSTGEPFSRLCAINQHNREARRSGIKRGHRTESEPVKFIIDQLESENLESKSTDVILDPIEAMYCIWWLKKNADRLGLTLEIKQNLLSILKRFHCFRYSDATRVLQESSLFFPSSSLVLRQNRYTEMRASLRQVRLSDDLYRWFNTARTNGMTYVAFPEDVSPSSWLNLYNIIYQKIIPDLKKLIRRTTNLGSHSLPLIIVKRESKDVFSITAVPWLPATACRVLCRMTVQCVDERSVNISQLEVMFCPAGFFSQSEPLLVAFKPALGIYDGVMPSTVCSTSDNLWAYIEKKLLYFIHHLWEMLPRLSHAEGEMLCVGLYPLQQDTFFLNRIFRIPPKSILRRQNPSLILRRYCEKALHSLLDYFYTLFFIHQRASEMMRVFSLNDVIALAMGCYLYKHPEATFIEVKEILSTTCNFPRSLGVHHEKFYLEIRKNIQEIQKKRQAEVRRESSKSCASVGQVGIFAKNPASGQKLHDSRTELHDSRTKELPPSSPSDLRSRRTLKGNGVRS